MATRNAKMSEEIKSYLDGTIKNLVTKSDIYTMKSFIYEQIGLLKDLTAKLSILDEKLNASEESIDKINVKITNLGGNLAYFESQGELKSRKIDDLEQYGRRESVRFSGFEMKENESKEECEDAVKRYCKNSLKVDIKESENSRNYRIGLKIEKNGKTFQQIIAKFNGFLLQTKLYRARTHKADIAIHMDLTKRPYLILKDACSKAKDCASIGFACADIKCSFCLQLKNGDWKLFSSLEELKRLLLEIQ